ncbi:metal-sensitive transcriptional regulator [Microbacterium sp. zg.Y1090]|uniref:metal-sensitive transcriptional regulator n=1 Tax=Microbacterium TaxID=33882 RepID=UPI00214C2AC4|nr:MULTISPECIES: metal-sensitive transcriptional regulator [unclassified Microbacterium]MCR2812925.1 metal-sensitive transcriptional regulator [Microbacterium sp. zg.Y1084]MCR2817266.1 metal-sensitive transcriptional regulator [Microbacterium sp. zg.Y1090]MDL5486066.1 metal-sensitive transcriptional regulator [Microbacterium sp. zg-Y1211]WIM29245.1 metal-sensitive transcriptional regulator [Microbacterium sp. zg-Y1090]
MTDVTAAAGAALHDPDAQRKIVNRLRRAQGQLAAVISAVESDASCRDVVQQLSAVSKALDRAGFLVISTALKECLNDPDAEGGSNPEELEKLFLSLA